MNKLKPNHPGSIALSFIATLFLVMGCGNNDQSNSLSAPRVSTGSLSEAEARVNSTSDDAQPATDTGIADLTTVDQSSTAFDSTIEATRALAGDDVSFSTNMVDLEAFVKGKTEEALFEFAESAAWKSPYASLQVFGHLSSTTKDPVMLMTSAGWIADLLQSYGYEEDRDAALRNFEALLSLYGNADKMKALSNAEREKLIATIQKHTVKLGMDASAWDRIVPVIRENSISDVEQTYADYYEAMTILWSGRKDEYVVAQSLLQSIQDRGVFGTYFAGGDEISEWLSLSDKELAENMKEVNAMRERALAARTKQWNEDATLSREQRLENKRN